MCCSTHRTRYGHALMCMIDPWYVAVSRYFSAVMFMYVYVDSPTCDQALKEDPMLVCSDIARYMKPHQIEGIRHVWRNVVQSAEHIRKEKPEHGMGCILAHFMGLGKTLQLITFLQMYLQQKFGTHVVRARCKACRAHAAHVACHVVSVMSCHGHVMLCDVVCKDVVCCM